MQSSKAVHYLTAGSWLGRSVFFRYLHFHSELILIKGGTVELKRHTLWKPIIDFLHLTLCYFYQESTIRVISTKRRSSPLRGWVLTSSTRHRSLVKRAPARNFLRASAKRLVGYWNPPDGRPVEALITSWFMTLRSATSHPVQVLMGALSVVSVLVYPFWADFCGIRWAFQNIRDVSSFTSFL